MKQPSQLLALPECLDAFVLGQGDHHFQLRSKEDNRRASLALVLQGRRSLHILSHDLAPAIYDHADFIEAVSVLARHSHHSQIQILVQDIGKLISHGHRIIELSRRLSSTIAIRQPHEQDRSKPAALLLVDERGLIYHQLSTQPEGIISYNAPIEGKNSRETFQAMWDIAQPDPGLRSLHL